MGQFFHLQGVSSHKVSSLLKKGRICFSTWSYLGKLLRHPCASVSVSEALKDQECLSGGKCLAQAAWGNLWDWLKVSPENSCSSRAVPSQLGFQLLSSCSISSHGGGLLNFLGNILNSHVFPDSIFWC